jgi:CRISPR/Cas system-associated exonuclease Cas4 (RecB family)
MIRWSYSSLKQYKTCPRQYYEIRVAKNFISREGDDARYGKEVHTALEHYVRDGTPLPRFYDDFRKMVDPLLEIPGTRYCEHEMALDIDRKPCDFHGETYWVRGIADLLVIDGDTAFIVDYKTGKPTYADPNQLKLMGLMVFAHFPEVAQIKSALMFLLHNAFVTEEYHRESSDVLWKSFETDLERLHIAFDNAIWPPNPTGLCRKHCPVESCKYFGGR